MSCKYAVYDSVKKKWLPFVTGYDKNNNNNGYAGNIGTPITGFTCADDVNNDLAYEVGLLGGNWLGEVDGCNESDAHNGFAGASSLNKQIDRIRIRSKSGKKVTYAVNCQGKGWLPSVTGSDRNDSKNGYAGNKGQAITAVMLCVGENPGPYVPSGNSPLVTHVNISPFSNPRNHKIDKITIHHMACNITVERCGQIFANPTRNGSSNYGVDAYGHVGLYVEEKNRAWTSSNRENDMRAVTIEVANDGGAPNWHVSDTAYNTLLNLVEDICRRNGIKQLNYTGDRNGNLTRHNMFSATLCPGPYLQSRFPDIATEINRRLSTPIQQKPQEPVVEQPTPTDPTPQPTTPPQENPAPSNPVIGGIENGTPPADAMKTSKPGDVNGDEYLDEKDLELLKEYLANLNEETGKSTVKVHTGADVNEDGKIDNKDVVALKNKLNEQIIPGDINGDGKITEEDLQLLKEYLANYDDETGKSTVTIHKENADLNGDGEINNKDVVVLKKLLQAETEAEEGLDNVFVRVVKALWNTIKNAFNK